ncbi:WYL domain-containing protein [Brooklawnia cerclae]|uniref:DNA-binding transcriptional regulator YafY n=1 Tax=Brooklawnia cerclae TaxID=349934 RepID=A0ABX0SME0_9ACTN|nr:putative DNA-binding transcriptional regulator YafY [Brooklawnia cerclae]
MPTESSPTARALLALEVIQTNPGVSAERLAAALGVTERAARRYVGILREAEIPILSRRGPYGGYTVGRGVRLPPLVFSAIEALGLVMVALDAGRDATDTADPVGSALAKILRALPEAVAAQAYSVRRTARAVPDRHAVRPDAATTAALVEACSARRVVRLGYRSEAGVERVRLIEPWGVVARQRRWYLVCVRVETRAVRTYRLDRVRSVEVTDTGFDLPADLDPVEVLEESLAAGWEYPTRVLIEAPVDEVSWLPRSIGHLEPVDEHRCRLVGSTSDPAWYAELLAELPVAFRVEQGTELRTAVRVLGQRLLDAGS